jgi:hypothetical protein
MTAMETDCSSVERITSTSRGIIWRSRGRFSAATMAPAPMEASSKREGAGIAAVQAARHQRQQGQQGGGMEKEDGDAQQHRATRADWPTNCRPTRMALTRRSRPSGLGAWSRRQRMMTKPERPTARH